MSAVTETLAAALAHHKAGRLDEAETAYRNALTDAPGRVSILHNLGVVIAGQGRHADALAVFEKAIGVEPGYGAAHYNRGVALEALGRTREAVGALARAALLEPGHYDTHRALGFLYLAQGDRERALDHFARTYELRRGDDRDGQAYASLSYSSRWKLRHDAAQLRHVAGRRRDGKRFELLARAYDTVAAEFPESIAALDDHQLDLLGEDYNTPIVVASAPEIAGGAVNPALDGAAVAADFGAQSCGGAICDDVLSEPAVVSLRRYLLESTIWHDFSHIGGFVATYLEDGLACPLILQIGVELRQALPEILGPHPLTQAWAFKGLEGSSSVAAHADDAAVTVNLWITPDAANLDPHGGGLRICRTLPPPDWEMTDYDADTSDVLAFMQRHSATTLTVPYASNRAAIFNSRLFHASDAPSFAPGYENHRINLTLLYGRQGSHSSGE